MSTPAGQVAKVLRIDDATLHAVPVPGGGFELHIVTSAGTQAVIASSPEQLVKGAAEVLRVAEGDPADIHTAGARHAVRLAWIKPKPETAETAQK